MKRYDFIINLGMRSIIEEHPHGEYVKFEDIEQKLTEYFEWDPDIENPAYAAKRFLSGRRA